MIAAWVLSAVVTTGAAAGYVDDRACATCHADRAKTYEQVGMSHAFFAPRADRMIEDFAAPPYFHEKSKQYFTIRRRGDALVFRRWEQEPDGTPVHLFEQKIDWILGSGHHARTYLYRTPGGELYQLPLSWYSQTREWAMAPGYDRADHEGVTHRVRHECLFCHNAYPDGVAPENKSYWHTQTFPAQLPEGLGCQRCHGPGAKHVETQTRESIVNPARLDWRRKMSICYECHMQPAVAMPPVRRFDRDIYSFRPGQLLDDYTVRLDIEPNHDRFEINHHPYRLEQSRCFRESEPGQLTCLNCHDPHRKVAEADRAAHYRHACMACHASPHHQDADCTTCHMQKRRTQDVVHVVMTDHFIRRVPGGPELVAPLAEREPEIADIISPAGELYRVAALIRARGGADAAAVARLAQLIESQQPAETEPYLDLALGQLRQRQYAQLEKTAVTILGREPDNALAKEWLGIARAGRTGRAEDAIRVLSALVKKEPRPEAEFNLGVFLGRNAEGIAHLERAVALRPNFVAAWIRLGEARQECGDTSGAREAFDRALAIDPSRTLTSP